MKAIIFATGNKRKLEEAKLGCSFFDIKVRQIKLNINEIQSADAKEISKNKAEIAFSIINKPLVVSDTFWNFPALKGFPGAYMKDMVNWLTSADFLNLMKNKRDRRVSFTESVTFKDSEHLKTFSKEYWGVIATKPRGIGNSIENVAEFEGFTLGERRAQGGFSHKLEDYILYEFEGVLAID